MLVIDTSGLISLASINILETVIEEYEVHVTREVVEELNETANYEDSHAESSEKALEKISDTEIHELDVGEFESSRVDKVEYSCVLLANKIEADFVITDDFRSLPELKSLIDSQIAISPIMLKALVKRDLIQESEARQMLEELAENRNWLGAPIYRHAQKLF